MKSSPVGGSGGQGQPNAWLIGSYRYHMDDKARVSLPRNMRRALGGQKPYLVVSSREKGRATIYPEKRWQEKAAAVPEAEREEFFAHSFELRIDEHGRVTFPETAMQTAGLGKRSVLVIAGVGERIEIYTDEKWQQRQQG